MDALQTAIKFADITEGAFDFTIGPLLNLWGFANKEAEFEGIIDLVKEKMASEDDERRAEDVIQKLTDQHVKEIDGLLEKKEADLMEI